MFIPKPFFDISEPTHFHMEGHSMSTTPTARMNAIQEATRRIPRYLEMPVRNDGSPMPVSEFFGEMSFSTRQLKQALSGSEWTQLEAAIVKGQSLDREVTNKIASVVKEWALSRGATHFTHWFQPQTEQTAEKHDAFLQFGDEMKTMDHLSASLLLQSEPDASSFPSGGLRATHEARGYTVWDPSSSFFIVENGNTRCLCIPSVFIGYNGEFLDERGPLLKSTQVLSAKATRVLELLGEKNIERVMTTLGPEQEYFAIDRAFFVARPDLVMTGRTLFGAKPPKGQQLEDHYFASIPDRIQAFMAEVEFELFRLGVPLKTRHNEVAPAQYETAPIFEESDQATDHNQLTMTVLKRVAKKHDLEVLLHEKPFAGINGSGKHCNWSMAAVGSKHGVNLLDPGQNPHQNTRFLLFLLATLKGVHKHAGVLRAGVASSGNDHRLGANEAPPAIISAFLGQTLSHVLDQIEVGSTQAERPLAPYPVRLGVTRLPELTKDTTDRNRTSPFAFTGNKFEFRAVGGSASTAFPVMLLNVAVADALDEVGVRLEAEIKKQGDVQKAAWALIRELVQETKSIRFEGNGYSEEWIYEAEKRGLPNLRKTPEALAQMVATQTVATFEKLGVLNKNDLHSRYHIRLEAYVKRMTIEATTMLQMVETMVLPAGFAYLRQLTDGIASAKAAGVTPPQAEVATKVSAVLTQIQAQRNALRVAFEKLETMSELSAQAESFAETIAPLMEETRVACDRLENEVSDEMWPLPRYREILFIS